MNAIAKALPLKAPSGKAGFIRGLRSKIKSFFDMPQNAINLVAPLKASKEAGLRRILQRIQTNTHHNTVLPFSLFADRLHFARFLILEGPDHPEEYGSSLVFIANVDGTEEDFLHALVQQAATGLDQVFEACQGYPPKSRRTKKSRFAFLQAHLLPAQAFYINTVGRGVQQILNEERLHNALQEALNNIPPEPNKSAKQLRQQVIEHVENSPDLSWALEAPEAPSFLWQAKEQLRFAVILSIGSAVLVISWPVLLAWLLRIQMLEKGDKEERHRPSLQRLNKLRAGEDFAAHNPFSAVGYVKSGILRRATARSLLASAQVALRHYFNDGNLAGIRWLGLDSVDTIHFAHWIMLENDRRLLFASNYDGSLESYMVDFVDKVSWGLNIIFSNGEGYPRTNWLVFEGARNEQRFKDYIGNHQVENQVWHAPYPHLTAVNIANNSALRAGLRGRMTEQQAQRWLQRF